MGRLFGSDPSMLALSYMWLCDLDRRRNIQCNARTQSLRKTKDNNILSRLHLDRGLTLLSWVPFQEWPGCSDYPPFFEEKILIIYIFFFHTKLVLSLIISSSFRGRTVVFVVVKHTWFSSVLQIFQVFSFPIWPLSGPVLSSGSALFIIHTGLRFF